MFQMNQFGFTLARLIFGHGSGVSSCRFSRPLYFRLASLQATNTTSSLLVE